LCPSAPSLFVLVLVLVIVLVVDHTSAVGDEYGTIASTSPADAAAYEARAALAPRAARVLPSWW
jgi:hypothetical protein